MHTAYVPIFHYRKIFVAGTYLLIKITINKKENNENKKKIWPNILYNIYSKIFKNLHNNNNMGMKIGPIAWDS